MAADLTAKRLRSVFEGLLETYGPQDWWPGQSPFEIAVGAILVQNTSWANAARAIERLADRRLLQPAALLDCAEVELQEAIRPSGIYRQKARRLREFARWLQGHGGFESLATRPTHWLRASLLDVHGIGPETADCILLYALRRPVFVVDAYSLRIMERIGLYRTGRGAAEALRSTVQTRIGADVEFFNEFHALLVEHGKRVCRPRPVCAGCALRSCCAYISQQARRAT